MNDSDFPALYRTADAAAVRTQTAFLNIFKSSTLLLLLGAIVSLINAKHAIAMIISALLFIGSLGVYIYGKSENFRATWYQSRALAESVKTSTWRLVMGADPFGNGLSVDYEKFRSLLNELLQENKGLAKHLGGQWSNEDQITPEMKRLIQLSFEEKKQYYLSNRINHQAAWYSNKAQICIDENNKHFVRLYFVYGLAILLLFVRVMMPTLGYIPVQVCAVVATSIISWMQLKKFDELASSYGLTAHEIGIIKSRIEEIDNQQKLADFVADSENAFSREHTQWAARRDH